MKKKIALFANGWGSEIVLGYGRGIIEAMKDDSVDLYTFLCYPSFNDDKETIQGEINIYSLPDLHDFDGAVILGNGMDFEGVFDKLVSRCKEAGIPAVSTGRTSEYTYFVGSDNYAGSYELAKHLIEIHKIKHPMFIAGSFNNPDSNERMKALKDVLSEHKMKLAEEDVFESRWEPMRAYMYVKEIFSRKAKDFPDAIVCANDSLAMMVSKAIIDSGYKVPEDVKVTGFDNEYYGRIYNPAIASVDQRFFDLGKESYETLKYVWDNGQPPVKKMVPCSYVPSESCGCTGVKDFEEMRKNIGNAKYTERLEESLFSRNLSRCERLILAGTTFEELRDKIREAYEDEHNFTGSSFHVVMEPLYEKSIFNPARKLRTEGYSRIMDVIFSCEKGKIISDKNFESRKLVPQKEKSDENRVYIFLPMHEYLSNFGYLVFCDNFELVGLYNRLHFFSMRAGSALAKYRQALCMENLNKRLLELTETDSLTHVKNRTAFEAKLKELSTKIRVSSKARFAFAMFDVNNLKIVNDELGHDAGDEYLINCCMMMCKLFKFSPVYRIGGDEFVAVLTGEDYTVRDVLLFQLRDKMAELAKENIPMCEKLSMASGIAEYDPELDESPQDVLKRADERMYDNKKIMKGKENVR